MPPSPSLRASPAKELQTENTHKRGHSFESGMLLKPKDDDLALFEDMQTRESDTFLLKSSDNFDESISELRYFPDFKLGVNIPPRGGINGLLNVDGDKNDYDWLLTPPDTPLFPSLDDEELEPICQAPRGRPQSKPMSITRSSTIERTQMSSSPNRYSPSSRSSSSAVQSRTRPSSSASRSSPPPVLQPSTPSRRPSAPAASKSLTPTRRSPSPALRRMSTGSGGQSFSNGRICASPVKANRGTSASPKLRGWQSNLPGFSSEAPPNLRTSFSDRPVSRSRGASPVSVSGFDSASKGRRQSMSPTPSRSASSSHSNERDRFSFYSKASAASSGEDDVESMQSLPKGFSSTPTARKNSVVMKSRPIASSKKPSKSFSPSSAPKRSFDSALWLMDQRKAPQNMFRPLLSSVPATTLDVGEVNSMHRPIASRNSSITTSSNVSSEHGVTLGPYIDIDHDQNEPSVEWEGAEGSDVQEEIFVFDKMDELNEDASTYVNEDASHERLASGPQIGTTREKLERTIRDFDIEAVGTVTPRTPCVAASDSQVEYGETMATCSRCGKLFNVMEVNEATDVCEECALREAAFSAEPEVGAPEEAHHLELGTASLKSCDILQPLVTTLEEDNTDAPDHWHSTSSESMPNFLDEDNLYQLAADTRNAELLEQQVNRYTENNSQDVVDLEQDNHYEVCFPESGSGRNDFQQKGPSTCVMKQDLLEYQMENYIGNEGPEDLLESDDLYKPPAGDNSQKSEIPAPSSFSVDNTEGRGISILLHKSSSSKWPVVEGRAFSATNILCSEPYYARDNISMMKSSFGRDSSSASSSVDIGYSRQAEVHLQRHRSGRKGDFEKALSSTLSAQSTSSVSEMSISGSSAPLCPQSDTNEDFGSRLDSVERKDSVMVMSTDEIDSSCKDTMSTVLENSCTERANVNEGSCINLDASRSSRLSEPAGDHTVTLDNSTSRTPNEDALRSGQMSSSEIEVPRNVPQTSVEEGHVPKIVDEDCASVVTAHCSSSGIPDQSCDQHSNENLQKQSELFEPSSDMEKLDDDDSRVPTISEEILDSMVEASTLEIPPNTSESTVTVEGPTRQIQRSFTLEEATDTILFCSSIIHDLAYKAATIGLERERESQSTEASRPTITIIDKSKQEDLPKVPNRRTPNSRKVKQKRLEADTTKSTETKESAKDLASAPSATGAPKMSDSMKPPKLESKCNCTIM